MLEPDVIIYTNEITFRPDDSLKGKDVFYEYIVAEDYRDTLVDLVFFDGRSMREPLTGFTKMESSSLYSPDVTSYNQTDFMWWRLDVSALYKEARDGNVYLTVKEYHKRRRIAFPESIPLKAV
jgi:hypothetical protein